MTEDEHSARSPHVSATAHAPYVSGLAETERPMAPHSVDDLARSLRIGSARWLATETIASSASEVSVGARLDRAPAHPLMKTTAPVTGRPPLAPRRCRAWPPAPAPRRRSTAAAPGGCAPRGAPPWPAGRPGPARPRPGTRAAAPSAVGGRAGGRRRT